MGIGWLLIGVALLVAGVVWPFTGYWRGVGATRLFDEGIVRWRGSRGIVSRNLQRQIYLVMIMSGLIVISLALAPARGRHRTVLDSAVSIVAGLMAMLVVVQFLFNRPRRVVPDRYRTQAGFVGEVRARVGAAPTPRKR